MHHAPPTWTCLHYQYPTPWNLPFTILHRTYEQHLFVPSVVPMPVGGNHHSVLLFFLSDKDGKCVHFFLEHSGRMWDSTDGRHASLKWHETKSVECVIKTCTCVLFGSTHIWQQIGDFKEICELNCSKDDTCTAHLQQTNGAFQVCDKHSKAWFSLWIGITEYSLNTLRSRLKSVTLWPARPANAENELQINNALML